jgi:hypothetical protein
MSKTADRVLGVHGFVIGLPYCHECLPLAMPSATTSQEL